MKRAFGMSVFKLSSAKVLADFRIPFQELICIKPAQHLMYKHGEDLSI